MSLLPPRTCNSTVPRSALGYPTLVFAAQRDTPLWSPPPSAASNSQKSGLSYERRVLSRLESLFNGALTPSVWFSYTMEKHDHHRYCQVDALVEGIRPVVFEIKLQWSDSLWWQLRRLYAPVVEKAIAAPALCAIVRSYDPAVIVPEPITLLRSPEDALALQPFEMGVVIWK